jgi:hypothetical protein
MLCFFLCRITMYRWRIHLGLSIKRLFGYCGRHWWIWNSQFRLQLWKLWNSVNSGKKPKQFMSSLKSVWCSEINRFKLDQNLKQLQNFWWDRRMLDLMRSSRHQSKLEICFISIIIVFFHCSPQIDSPVNISISTSLPTITKCFCQMISKGVLVNQRTIVFNKQTAMLTFTPTFAFAPRTEIIFFAISPNGSVITRSLTLDLKDKLPNYVRSSLTEISVWFDRWNVSRLSWNFQKVLWNQARTWHWTFWQRNFRQWRSLAWILVWWFDEASRGSKLDSTYRFKTPKKWKWVHKNRRLYWIEWGIQRPVGLESSLSSSRLA